MCLLSLMCLGPLGRPAHAVSPVGPHSDVVWQLGETDGKADDFIPIMYNHFLRDAPLLHRPEYDRSTNTYTFRIGEQSLQTKPDFPSGLATMEAGFIIGDHLPRRITIEWDDKDGGPKVLEIHTASWQNAEYARPASHYAFDNYSDFLRVDTPDGGAAFFQLPLTSASGTTPPAKGEGDLNWSVPFVSAPGPNRIELSSVQYATRPAVYFDCLTLRKVKSLPARKPAVVLSTEKLGNAFFDGDTVTAHVDLLNLPQDRNYSCAYSVEDFFGNVVDTGNLPLTPDPKDASQLTFRPNVADRGHFQMTVWLQDQNGQTVPLGQCVDKPILPFAVIAPPEEPSADNLDSRFGFVGGMCAYSNNLSLVDADRFFNVAYIMGARWHRFDMFSWRMIEPEKGTYYWKPVDDMVDLVRRNHINIMGEIAATPNWAKLNPEDKGTHVNLFEVPRLDEFTRFVKDVVTRYKGRVAAWEYMNEPSVHYGVYNAPAYAEMMKTMSTPIRSIDPQALAVMGCGGIGGQDRKWTLDTIAAAGKDAFDVFTLHYLVGTPWTFCREIIDKADIADKPVWDTEQHFNSGISMKDEARQLIRVYPKEFSYGVEKVFYFDLNFNMVWGSSDLWFSPLMVAHRTLAHRIDHTKYLARIAPAADVEGHVFQRKNGEASLVIWNNAAAAGEQRNDAGAVVSGRTPVIGAWKAVTLKADKENVTLVDIMDNERTLPVADGKVEFALGEDPVFIEGIAPMTLLAQAVLTDTPAESVVASAVPSLHSIEVRNVFPERIAGDLVFDAPPGLSVSCNESSFDLPPGASKRFQVEVTTPSSAEHRAWPVNMTASFSAGPPGLDSADARIAVVTHPAGPGANLLPNAGFEEPALAGWRVLTGEAEPTDEPALGRRALRLTADAKLRSPDLDVLPGEYFALGLSVRGAAQVALHASFKDASGESLKPMKVASFESAKDWSRIAGALCVPPRAAGMALEIETSAPVTVDEAEVRLLPDANVNLTKLQYSLPCKRLAQPLKIDGELSKWKALGVEPVVLDRLDQVRRRHISGAIWEPKPYDWHGPSDLSARIFFAWDADNFYVAARVWDDKVVSSTNPAAAKDLWYAHPFGDAFQIAIDPDDGKQDMAFNIVTLAGGRVLMTVLEDYVNQGLLPTGRDVSDDVAFSIKPLSDGLVYEVAIPWKLAGITPASGKAIGATFGLQEFDDEYRGWMEWPPRMRNCYLVDPAALGEITLAK